MGDFEFKCNECGQILIAAEEHMGKRAECPKCGIGFEIPTLLKPLARVKPPSPTTTEILTCKTSSQKDCIKKEWKIMSKTTGFEYGPVSLTTLKRWVRQRRVRKKDKVRHLDSKEWIIACELSELSHDFEKVWPLYKVLRAPLILLAIVAVLVSGNYYKNHIRRVSVQTGMKVTCNECSKIISDTTHTVRVSASKKASYRITYKKGLCEGCARKIVQVLHGERIVCEACSSLIEDKTEKLRIMLADKTKYRVATKRQGLCENCSKMVPVETGERVICRSCDKLVADNTKTLNVTQVHKDKYRITVTYKECKSCVGKRAREWARKHPYKAGYEAGKVSAEVDAQWGKIMYDRDDIETAAVFFSGLREGHLNMQNFPEDSGTDILTIREDVKGRDTKCTTPKRLLKDCMGKTARIS